MTVCARKADRPGNYANTYALEDYEEVIILGSAFADDLSCTLPIKCTIYGEDGEDSITADPIFLEDTQEYPVVQLFGGDHDDTIYGAGNAEIEGDDGNDSLYCNSAAPCTIRGEAGDDFIQGNAGDDFLYGGWGDDVIVGQAGTDHIFGGKDNDTLTGEFCNIHHECNNFDLSPDVIDGGAGFDAIAGLGASDVVTNVEQIDGVPL